MTKFVEILDTTSEDDAKKLFGEIKKHVSNKGKSILFLTASWCGPCKAFKPTIVEFKNKMKKTTGLVAHVDVKYHDNLKEIINVDINGYPTVAVAEGNQENKEQEKEGMDLESLLKLQTSFFTSQGGKRKRRRKRKTYKSKSRKKGTKTKKRKKRHRRRKKTRKTFSKKSRKNKKNI